MTGDRDGSVQCEEQWRWRPQWTYSLRSQTGGREAGFNVLLDQSPKTLQDDRDQAVVIEMAGYFGSGLIVVDFRHGGIMDLDRDRLKTFVKTSESCTFVQNPSSWRHHVMRAGGLPRVHRPRAHASPRAAAQ